MCMDLVIFQNCTVVHGDPMVYIRSNSVSLKVEPDCIAQIVLQVVIVPFVLSRVIKPGCTTRQNLSSEFWK